MTLHGGWSRSRCTDSTKLEFRTLYTPKDRWEFNDENANDQPYDQDDSANSTKWKGVLPLTFEIESGLMRKWVCHDV